MVLNAVDGSLTPDSFRADRMPATVAVGHKRKFYLSATSVDRLEDAPGRAHSAVWISTPTLASSL